MRVAEARDRFADHPRIDVTAFEEEIGARYTVDTLAYLKRRYPGCPFRLDHGGGQPGGLPPLAGLAPHRPDDADRRHRPARLDPEGGPLAKRHRPVAAAGSGRADARALPGLEPPAWVFLHGPRSHLSSTAAAPVATNFSLQEDVEKSGPSRIILRIGAA